MPFIDYFLFITMLNAITARRKAEQGGGGGGSYSDPDAILAAGGIETVD